MVELEKINPCQDQEFFEALKESETLQVLYLDYYPSLDFNLLKSVIENHSSLRELYLSSLISFFD
jgi:hypothetical protein